MPQHTYVVIDGDRLITSTHKLRLARAAQGKLASRRIIRLETDGPEIVLQTARPGGTFTIRGVEVE